MVLEVASLKRMVVDIGQEAGKFCSTF